MEEQTLSILKPDSIAKNVIGSILERFEKNNFKIIAARMTHLSKQQAETFYEVHKGKPFFEDLTTFMSSGPILALVLSGKNAIERNRQLMGNTNPQKAEKGTIRKDFASSIDQNAVHGSDSPDSAKTEIAFFFKPSEIFSR